MNLPEYPPEYWVAFLQRAETVLQQFSLTLPPIPSVPDWSQRAFRWRVQHGRGRLEAVRMPHQIALDELACVDRQKQRLVRNTAAFVAGRPANNVLLTGARGTGKSSLVKALLWQFADQGLRLIEVDKTDLVDLAEIIECVAERPERFIIYCDDLSFESGDHAYKALKTALDGGVTARTANVLIYATSNRRHLMPNLMRDNVDTQTGEHGEVIPSEAIEEKISLSERFGLWLSFYPFSQEEYLAAVEVWLRRANLVYDELAERAALHWALARGARSGRVAWQFVQDWAGRLPEERHRMDEW